MSHIHLPAKLVAKGGPLFHCAGHCEVLLMCPRSVDGRRDEPRNGRCNVKTADILRPPVRPVRAAATAKTGLQGQLLTRPLYTGSRGRVKLDSGVPKAARENNPRERR